jgi:predicted transcriptional regulator
MKTAVSVPDDLFARADRLAKRSRRSRSEVYSAALREYLARHAPDEVTAGLDAALAGLGQPDGGGFTDTAARRTLESSEW